MKKYKVQNRNRKISHACVPVSKNKKKQIKTSNSTSRWELQIDTYPTRRCDNTKAFCFCLCLAFKTPPIVGVFFQ